jgi:hypothetical protein
VIDSFVFHILDTVPTTTSQSTKPARQLGHAMQISYHSIHFIRNWLYSRSINIEFVLHDQIISSGWFRHCNSLFHPNWNLQVLGLTILLKYQAKCKNSARTSALFWTSKRLPVQPASSERNYSGNLLRGKTICSISMTMVSRTLLTFL